MQFIDLTHTFTDQMPVYPGDPIPTLLQVASLEKEGYVDHQITSGMHVGTHMDAPLHFIPGGQRLDEISPECFFGRGVLIDARGRTEIGVELLDGVDIKKDDVVVVCSGHGRTFGAETYYQSYPFVAEAFAEKLIELGVRMLGLDTPSPDGSPFAVHKILLARNVLIIENLSGLEQLVGVSSFDIVALPPKLRTEGAPVRVVALVHE